jgi:hypothetical protein
MERVMEWSWRRGKIGRRRGACSLTSIGMRDGFMVETAFVMMISCRSIHFIYLIQAP